MQLREMVIKGSMSNLKRFIDNLPMRLTDGWWHDTEDEKYYEEQGITLKAIRTPKNSLTLEQASIYLKPDGSGTQWRLDRVVPPPDKTGQIPVELRNVIVNDFYEKFVRVQAADYGLIVEISPNEITLDYLVSNNKISKRNADYLKSVVHALESYGSISNPQDEDKFYNFVCGTFRERQTIPNDLLRTLLRDEFGIAEDKANGLVGTYERLSQFLDHYTKFELMEAKSDVSNDGLTLTN